MKEIIHKYKSNATRLLRLFENIYSWLPVASLIDEHIFVTHGGISNITDLATINQIKRQKVLLLRLYFCFHNTFLCLYLVYICIESEFYNSTARR